ncbi:MAG TPA: LLM class flavin-dependent oxidoreductase [Acidimicrobiia bacterium]|nr:LLM class flavin-dependent oxidoreductase [Acidimicrobiia bacterium]
MSGPEARQTRGRVKVGLYVDPVAPLAGVAAGIRLAQVLRADDVWLGDHTRAMLPDSVWDPATNPLARLVPDLDAYFDPTVVIARYAGRFGPRIGTSVTDSIRRSPADLARAWLTLHHVTGGKAVLGIGSGEIENTVPYGQSTARSVTRLDDTLGAIRAAWESEGKPLTHAGPFHHWEHATFAVPPRKGTFPPIWVAAQGPNACRAAGRWGDGWINVHHGFDAWRRAAGHVAEGAVEAGRNPEALERSLVIAGVLAKDRSSLEKACASPVMRAAVLALPGSDWAEAGLEHPLGESFGGYAGYDPALITPDVMAEAGRRLSPESLARLMPSGTGAAVAGYLSEYVAAGLTHVIVINLMPACGLRLAAESMVELRKLMGLLRRMRPGPFAG